MPLSMRYGVTAELSVTIRADDGTMERFTVQGSARSATYDEALTEAVSKAVKITEDKAGAHAQVVLDHETERLK